MQLQHEIPVVAKFIEPGLAKLLTNTTVSVISPVKGVIKAVSIQTASMPGYYKGELVMFDVNKPPCKDRHAIAYNDGVYYIVSHNNNKWSDIVSGIEMSYDASIYAIVGTMDADALNE